MTVPPGSPAAMAIVGSTARCRPVALRPGLSPGLPLFVTFVALCDCEIAYAFQSAQMAASSAARPHSGPLVWKCRKGRFGR